MASSQVSMFCVFCVLCFLCSVFSVFCVEIKHKYLKCREREREAADGIFPNKSFRDGRDTANSLTM